MCGLDNICIVEKSQIDNGIFLSSLRRNNIPIIFYGTVKGAEPVLCGKLSSTYFPVNQRRISARIETAYNDVIVITKYVPIDNNFELFLFQIV